MGYTRITLDIRPTRTSGIGFFITIHSTRVTLMPRGKIEFTDSKTTRHTESHGQVAVKFVLTNKKARKGINLMIRPRRTYIVVRYSSPSARN